ncbi:MAG TPA: teichoic acid D-Ala incorporation-associated protein DltX [Chloroflexota bacterium]
MIRDLIALSTSPRLRTTARTLLYLSILVGLLLLYGKGDFTTPSFVYQGF